MAELTALIPEDEILVKGCLANNRHSQELLYRKYATKMYHIALSFTGNRDEAKDILQDSFIKVFKSLDTFNAANSLEGWIRKIVNNTAIDYFRRQKSLRYIESTEETEAREVVLAEDPVHHWNTEAIFGFIRNLPEGARIVFHLFAVEGYSHKEIAVRLNITEGTSKSQYNRARMLLQEWIKRSA